MKRLMIVAKGCILTLLIMSVAYSQTWTLAKSTSKVNFEIQSIHGKVRGNFSQFDAKLNFDPNDLVNSSISGKIQTSSISTKNGSRDAALRDKKYFHSSKFSDMTFSSKKIMQDGSNFVAVGTISIKGKSREFKLPFSFDGERFKASFKIKITDFDISGGGFFHDDEVKVMLDLPVSST